jgi:hypothetical protein
MKFSIDLVRGVEGDSIDIMDCDIGSGRRICGPKAWGGGKVIRSWKVNIDDVLDAFPKSDIQKYLDERNSQ